MRNSFFFLLHVTLLTGIFAGEIVISDLKFETPLILPPTSYYTNSGNYSMVSLRKAHEGLTFRSDTVFKITAEVECDPGATAGMKLRQIYEGEKDARISDIFWNKGSGTIEAQCKLHPDAVPEAVSLLQFIFYNCKKNGEVKLKSLKITAENVNLGKPDPLAGREPVLERSFNPALKLQHGTVSLVDIPFGADDVSPETVYTVELKVTGYDGIRLGLRLRHDLSSAANPLFVNFFWHYPLADNQESTLVYSARLSKISADALWKLSLVAANTNQRGHADIHSVRVFQAKETPVQPMEIPQQTFTSLEFSPGYFLTGVYFYGSPAEIAKFAEARKLTVDEYLHAIFRDIADHGCNTVLFAGVSGDPDMLRHMCSIAAQYALRVFVQGGGNLYLQPARGLEYFEDISCKAYQEILPQYRDIPNLDAFIPLEEINPDPAHLEIQAKGREAIKKLLPDKLIFTLHNRIPSMQMDSMAPQPDWYGFDRYRFRHIVINNELVISTPADMAILLRNEIIDAYQIAASRNRPLIFVAQGYKREETHSMGGPRSGLNQIAPDKWRGYIRYMPENGMNLQFWLAVSCGARGFLLYFYQTTQPESEDQHSDGLVAMDGRESWYWREMGECLRNAKVFSPLFQTWFRERNSSATANDDKVYVSTFIRPDLKGKFIVPVNTHIADWDEDSPRRPVNSTELKSDAENLQGFRWAGEKEFDLKLQHDGKLWDIRSGDEISSAGIKLPPGGGIVLFQGEADELAEIRRELAL